jgi:hypothetical protein
MKITHATAIVACLFFSAILPLQAKTIKFPAENPDFSFDLPEGWAMEADKSGDLVCKSGDGVLTLNLSKMNQSFAKVKERLPALGKTFTEVFKMTKVEAKDLGDDKNKKGVKESIYLVKGKWSDMDFVAVLRAFDPKDGGAGYFIMFSGLATGMTAHVDDMGAIIDSITPMK